MCQNRHILFLISIFSCQELVIMLDSCFSFSDLIYHQISRDGFKLLRMWPISEPGTDLYATLFIFAIIFLILKAVAKKAKSIKTLSLPK